MSYHQVDRADIGQDPSRATGIPEVEGGRGIHFNCKPLVIHKLIDHQTTGVRAAHRLYYHPEATDIIQLAHRLLIRVIPPSPASGRKGSRSCNNHRTSLFQPTYPLPFNNKPARPLPLPAHNSHRIGEGERSSSSSAQCRSKSVLFSLSNQIPLT